MLFMLTQVIGVLAIIGSVPEHPNGTVIYTDNRVCLTNYVQTWEINCATFCLRS